MGAHYGIPPWEIEPRCTYYELAELFASIQADSDYSLNMRE